MVNLPEHVKNSIRERKLLRRGERILVAVSGGLDSMVLLQLLHSLASPPGWKLIVAHFNHQLRGRASDADERLVCDTAKSLGLQTISERGEVQAHAEKWRISIEMAARDLRHEFLARTARCARCRIIAIAHHADDQAELFFLRLLRGAGGEGLAGMKWRAPSPADDRVHLIRPLLDVGRAELEQFADDSKIHFREDATNASREILRNRIRHELLPLMRRRFQPGLNKSLLRAMEIVGAESELVASIARRWLAKKQPPFVRLAVAVQRRVVQLQLRRLELAEDFDLIEALRLSCGRPVTIGPEVTVARNSAGRVLVRTVTREPFQSNFLALDLGGQAGAATLDDLHLHWKVIAQTGARLRLLRGCEQFDADKVGRHVVLRHWQPGDRFQPIGMASAMKLQDWFTNQKVPRPERRHLVVAGTATGEVFWVENQRIGERFKLGPETQRRLIWTWRRSASL